MAYKSKTKNDSTTKAKRKSAKEKNKKIKEKVKKMGVFKQLDENNKKSKTEKKSKKK